MNKIDTNSLHSIKAATIHLGYANETNSLSDCLLEDDHYLKSFDMCRILLSVQYREKSYFILTLFILSKFYLNLHVGTKYAQCLHLISSLGYKWEIKKWR